MGAFVNGICHPDAAAASDAYFATGVPVVIPGATTYRAWYEKVSGVWKVNVQTIPGTTTSYDAAVPVFVDCDETVPLTDGLALGWMVGGVLLAVWGMRLLARLLR